MAILKKFSVKRKQVKGKLEADAAHDESACGDEHGHQAPASGPKANDDHGHSHGGAGHGAEKGGEHGEDCGQDHSSENHDHSHRGQDHAHFHDLQGPTFVECAGARALQLHVEEVLPGETEEDGRFIELRTALSKVSGVTQVHLVCKGARIDVCVHHGRDVTDELLVDLRAAASVVSRRFRQKVWLVRGMDSAQCAPTIEHALSRQQGVLTAAVAYGAERLVVDYDAELVTETQLAARVSALGYELDEPPAGHACAFHDGGGDGLAPKLGPWLVGVSGVLLSIGYALTQFVPEASLVSQILYAGALGSAGYFPGKSAFAALRQGRADIETLTVVAAIGAGLTGAWGEGGFLLFLFSLGHTLEHRAMERARRAVEALAELRPDTARVRRGNDVVEVRADTVKIDEVVVVRPGDSLPLDGVVVNGQSHLNQAAITGESIPVARSVGDTVWAGTANQDGALEIRVTKTAGQSTLARLVEMVASAEARKSPAQRLTAKLEAQIVPFVLLGAPLLTGVLMFMGYSLQDAVLRGLSLLVAASPCALAVATPSVVLSAVAAAARAGVLIRGGADLAALGTVRGFAFDKTGTLTVGKPSLVEVVTFAMDEREMLAISAGVESLSGHPIAGAVVKGAKDRGIEPRPAEDLVAVHGKGVRALVAGKRVEIGTLDLLQTPPPTSVVERVAAMQAAGRTTMTVAIDGVVVGILGVADTLRTEAASVIAELTKLGVERTVMLSGDNHVVASAIAGSVGIQDTRAPLMPEGKVAAIRELARRGGVAMVGDGVNDAPALATATVGVAMGGGGADITLQTADVVLMGDDLRKLSFAVALARASNQAVRQNIGFSVLVAAVLVVASVFGWVGISDAVIVHEGSTLFVVFNGLRLLRWKRD